MKQLLILFATIISLNVYSQNTYGIKEINFGESIAKKLYEEKLRKSPSGHHNTTDWSLYITKRTDTIKAELGKQFGIEYQVINNKNEITDIQITWVYPKGMKDQHGKPLDKTTYSITKETNSYTYSNYTLETENEVVKGEWIFIISKNGKELYRKRFFLI